MATIKSVTGKIIDEIKEFIGFLFTDLTGCLAALDKILAELRGRHRIPRKGVVCHRELKSTVCPGAHLAAWTRRYRRAGPKLANLTGGQVRLQTASGSARGNAGRALSLDPTSVR